MKVIVLDEGLMKKAKFSLSGGKPQVDPDGNPEMYCRIGDTEIFLNYDETSRYPWAVSILLDGDASIDDSGDMHTYELDSYWKDYESALDLANEVARGIKPDDDPWSIRRKFMMFDMTKIS